MKSSKGIDAEEFSVAIPQKLNIQLQRHLLRNEGQEDIAFALYKPSIGSTRFTALVHSIILPEKDDSEVHGNVDISPEYFKRVCRIAMAEKSGIVLLHSHLGPGWQGMSSDDIRTEKGYSSTTLSLTELPFVGLTLGTDGTWSARAWEYINGWFERKFATTVRVVGKRLDVSFYDNLRPVPAFKEIYKRTITVWGKKNHDNIARLRIGIVGLGSVGSIIAESLARMGIERVVCIDFDELQIHNLDRLLGATINDVGQLKAHIALRQIQKASTATKCEVRPVLFGVTEEEGYKNALDCDVLFSCVDRPWPRHVLNHLAYNHLIPVIDGGIKVRFDKESHEFEGADWQAQTVGPDRICLQCLKAYDPADVSTEKEGLLEQPSYLEGLPIDSNFKRNENIFPFSLNLASLEILQLIEMVTGIGNKGFTEPQRYTYNQGYIRLLGDKGCADTCLFKAGIALSDTLFPPPTGFDHSANNARKRQSKKRVTEIGTKF